MLTTTLAAKLGIPLQRVNELCKGKRGITPETAWLLYKAFDVSPQFWMNLQTSHDLSHTRPRGLTLPKPSPAGGLTGPDLLDLGRPSSADAMVPEAG